MNTVMTVGYKLVRNATPTAAVAPYTALPIPVGSLAFDNILTRMLDGGTFMTKSTAQYLLKAFFEYAADEISENVVRISIGSVSLYPAISGSFPSEDAAFDKAQNALYVGASFSQALRDSVSGVEPSYRGAPSAKGMVKLASVMDLASKTMGVIDGTNEFRLAGVNLAVPDGEGESLAIYTKDVVTKVCDIVVSENDGGLYLKCALANAEVVKKGCYKIRLASRGLDPSDPLVIVTCPVTLVADVPPRTNRAVLTDLRTSDQDAPEELSVDDGIRLTFDKIDSDEATGNLVVDGVQQPAPVTVSEREPWVMWTFGQDELVGQRVTFKFRYEDGTETGNVTKTIRPRRG